MFQLLAAWLFTLALIAPLAVIVLTLQQNWSAIAAALQGNPVPAPMVIKGSKKPRGIVRVSPRSVQQPLQPVRAAA